MEAKNNVPKIGQLWQHQSTGNIYRIRGISKGKIWMEDTAGTARVGIVIDGFNKKEYHLYQDFEVSNEAKFNVITEVIAKRLENRQEHIQRLQWILNTRTDDEAHKEGLQNHIEKLQRQIDVFRVIKYDLKNSYMKEKQQLNTGIDYKKIFNFFHENHNLSLLESEIQEIAHVIKNANSDHQPTGDESELSETEIMYMARKQY